MSVDEYFHRGDEFGKEDFWEGRKCLEHWGHEQGGYGMCLEIVGQRYVGCTGAKGFEADLPADVMSYSSHWIMERKGKLPQDFLHPQVLPLTSQPRPLPSSHPQRAPHN